MGDQALLLSNGAHGWLFQIANRKQGLRNMLLGEGVEEVALIFIVIQTTQHLPVTILITAAYIMAGSDIVSAKRFSSKLQKGFKLDFFIAHNVRVRGAPGFIFG